MQMVKSMEKFFLRTFFSYNKLNIIDKQYVIVSIFFTELCHCKLAAGLTCFQSLDKFVRKSLACDIENIFRRIVLQDKVGDGMHKMRLAKHDTSIDEKWIICLSGR